MTSESIPDYLSLALKPTEATILAPFSPEEGFVVIPLARQDLNLSYAVVTEEGRLCGCVRVPLSLRVTLLNDSRESLNEEAHRQVTKIIESVRSGRVTPRFIEPGLSLPDLFPQEGSLKVVDG